MNLSVGTSHTFAFVREFLPASANALVEVGAGVGELSAALAALSYSIIPIDSDPDSVSTMKSRGLNAVLASWTDYVGPPVDAVIFSRSLHHLPLEAAVRHARDLLAPNGRLIVEDFAFTELPPDALAWFRQLLVRLAAAGVWRAPSDGFLAAVLAGAELSDERHEIASADAMERVLAAHGAMIHVAPAAYFYRYLLPGLPASPAGAAVLRQSLDEEAEVIAAGTLWPLGRRWVVQV